MKYLSYKVLLCLIFFDTCFCAQISPTAIAKKPNDSNKSTTSLTEKKKELQESKESSHPSNENNPQNKQTTLLGLLKNSLENPEKKGEEKKQIEKSISFFNQEFFNTTKLKMSEIVKNTKSFGKAMKNLTSEIIIQPFKSGLEFIWNGPSIITPWVSGEESYIIPVNSAFSQKNRLSFDKILVALVARLCMSYFYKIHFYYSALAAQTKKLHQYLPNKETSLPMVNISETLQENTYTLDLETYKNLDKSLRKNNFWYIAPSSSFITEIVKKIFEKTKDVIYVMSMQGIQYFSHGISSFLQLFWDNAKTTTTTTSNKKLEDKNIIFSEKEKQFLINSDNTISLGKIDLFLKIISAEEYISKAKYLAKLKSFCENYYQIYDNTPNAIIFKGYDYLQNLFAETEGLINRTTNEHNTQPKNDSENINIIEIINLIMVMLAIMHDGNIKENKFVINRQSKISEIINNSFVSFVLKACITTFDVGFGLNVIAYISPKLLPHRKIMSPVIDKDGKEVLDENKKPVMKEIRSYFFDVDKKTKASANYKEKYAKAQRANENKEGMLDTGWLQLVLGGAGAGKAAHWFLNKKKEKIGKEKSKELKQQINRILKSSSDDENKKTLEVILPLIINSISENKLPSDKSKNILDTIENQVKNNASLSLNSLLELIKP